MSEGRPEEDRSTREHVRFYLLDHRTPFGKVIDVVLLILNLVFVAVFVAETYPIGDATKDVLWSVEVGITVVFLLEYALRLYGAESRIDEFLNGYTMADLLAIVPTLAIVSLPVSTLPLGIGTLRVLRVLRVLRFYRFTDDAEFFFGRISENTLQGVKLLLTVLVLLFMTAGVFYSVESPTNPAISTYGDAFYYTVISVTTTGFGDILPTTAAGRWTTIAAILAGIVVIPWQAGRIVRQWAAGDKVDVTCTNCGLSNHDPDASHCKACGAVIYQESE
jgi:voltage-gated potassium channel